MSAASSGPSAPGALPDGAGVASKETFQKLSTLLDTVCNDPATFSPTLGHDIDAAAFKLLEETPRKTREGQNLIWKAALSIWNCVCVPVTNAQGLAESSRREMVEQSISALRLRVWCAAALRALLLFRPTSSYADALLVRLRSTMLSWTGNPDGVEASLVAAKMFAKARVLTPRSNFTAVLFFRSLTAAHSLRPPWLSYVADRRHSGEAGEPRGGGDALRESNRVSQSIFFREQHTEQIFLVLCCSRANVCFSLHPVPAAGSRRASKLGLRRPLSNYFCTTSSSAAPATRGRWSSGCAAPSSASAILQSATSGEQE